MKTSILTAIMFLCAQYGFSQINVGSKLMKPDGTELYKGIFQLGAGKKGKDDTGLTPEKLERLYNSKTIFVYPGDNKEEMGEFAAQIKKAWNLTDLEFVLFSEVDLDNYDDSYSFFTITALEVSSTNNYNGVETVSYSHYFFFSLWMLNEGRVNYYAQMQLYPDYLNMKPGYTCLPSEPCKELVRVGNVSYSFHNYNALNVKNAMQFMQVKLEKGEKQSAFVTASYPGIEKLKTETLYVPKYILQEYKPLKGGPLRTLVDKDKIFKGYDYKYEVINEPDLRRKALTNDENVLYMSALFIGSYKTLFITEAATGKIVYVWNSYADSKIMPASELKKEDIDRLSKAIDSIKK